MPNSGPHEITEEEIERALARPWYRMGLGATLDRQFEAATVARRNGDLRRQMAILGVCNAACLMLDDNVGLLKPGLLLRLGLVLPLIAIAFWALGRSWPVWRQGLVVMAPLCALLVTAVTIGKMLEGWASDRYIMAAGIMICAVNLVMPLRSRHALILTGLNAALFVGIAAWPGGRPSGELVDLVLFFLALTALSVRVVQRIDRSHKDMVLYDLRSRLQAEALVRANRELDLLSSRDHLTGIPNRRAFEASLLASVQAAQRTGAAVGLLLIDIDQFKSFNDTAGHLAGDRALQQVAATIQAEVAPSQGTVARFGGEEFAVVLADGRGHNIVAVAERIRRAVEGRHLRHPGFGGAAVVTISVGAALMAAMAETDLVAAADRALYAAKAAGRNCVVLSDAAGTVERRQRRTAG